MNDKTQDLKDTLETALRVSSEAGALLKTGFRSKLEVHLKGSIDLVTEYDLRSQALIRDALRSAFPDHEFIGEEGDSSSVRSPYRWYVDPIDGTTNFAHGHPAYSVSIALYHESEALVGVVHAPSLDVTWCAARGLGAFRNGERCYVSDTATLERALAATGFPYDVWSNADDNVNEFRRMLKHTQGVRRCGSAALDLAWVADGSYDFYWEQRLKPWDICAGALIVSEAGGKLSDYDGGTADPLTGRLVASNGTLHASVITLLAAADT